MRKRIIAAVLLLTMICSMALSACAPAESEEKGGESSEGKDVIRMGIIPSSGHVFTAIAEDKGYFEEENIEVELVPCSDYESAFASLSAGKVDLVSTFGTNMPLQYIGEGTDLTIFAGYMLTGAMPIIAKEGTKWNGVEDLIGKTVACPPSQFAVTGPLLDMGYDPMEEIEWLSISDHADRMAAVASGEADYAIIATGMAYNAPEMGLEIMCYQSDVLPEYSCCRAACNTQWLEENPDTVKSLLKAWIRADQVFESDKDYGVAVTAEQLDLEEDYVAFYMKDEHYQIEVDPDWKAVSRAWDYMVRLGMISEEAAANTDLKEHFNCELYKEALDECVELYYDEDPEFYDYYLDFYEKNNQL